MNSHVWMLIELRNNVFTLAFFQIDSKWCKSDVLALLSRVTWKKRDEFFVDSKIAENYWFLSPFRFEQLKKLEYVFKYNIVRDLVIVQHDKRLFLCDLCSVFFLNSVIVSIILNVTDIIKIGIPDITGLMLQFFLCSSQFEEMKLFHLIFSAFAFFAQSNLMKFIFYSRHFFRISHHSFDKID